MQSMSYDHLYSPSEAKKQFLKLHRYTKENQVYLSKGDGEDHWIGQK